MLEYIYTAAFIVASSILLGLLFNHLVILKVLCIWLLFTTIAFFGHTLLLFIAVFALGYFLWRESELNKIFYFICLSTAIPMHEYNVLSLDIWWVNYQVVLAVVLLLPVCINAFSSSNGVRSKLNGFDILFFSLVIYLCILEYRDDTFFTNIRKNTNFIIIMVLPYLAITRYIVNERAFELFFAGVAIAVGMLTVAAIGETVFHWKTYTYMLFNMQVDFTPSHYLYRNGLLRTAGGTAYNPLVYAYISVILLLICLHFLNEKKFKIFHALIFIAAAMLALYFTGSRGGVLFLLIGVLILYFHLLSKFMKIVAFFFGMIVVPILFGVVFGEGFSDLDDQGTFAYRQDLFGNALVAIKDSFLFGHANPRAHPAMLKSLQGEGIVDLVNVYLSFTLHYGIVGLTMLMLFILIPIYKIFTFRSLNLAAHKPLILSILVGSLVYITSASLLEFLAYFFWMMLFAAVAYKNMLQTYHRNGQ